MSENYSEVILILIISTTLILLFGAIMVSGLLIQQKRKLRYQQELSELKNRYERSLLEARLKIQEETFRAISQNLHDNVGSNISTAMLLLYKDEQISIEEDEINRKEALTMLDRIIDDLKNIARSLNPNYLIEIGLNEAIIQRVEQLKKTKKYEIEFQLSYAPQQLDRQKQVIVFYIFQEALNNINKHSGAKKIMISLEYEEDKFTMRIKDDGKGITGKEVPEEQTIKGSGLINMRNHAAIIGAQLSIQSLTGSGTEVIIIVPLPYTMLSIDSMV
jgi:signal transduction histidine kinase